jgi:uncharacterized protein YnzC (UPF0291/DUF896 family)
MTNISRINYLRNKVHTYPIAKEAKEKELVVYKTHYITINIMKV